MEQHDQDRGAPMGSGLNEFLPAAERDLELDEAFDSGFSAGYREAWSEIQRGEAEPQSPHRIIKERTA